MPPMLVAIAHDLGVPALPDRHRGRCLLPGLRAEPAGVGLRVRPARPGAHDAADAPGRGHPHPVVRAGLVAAVAGRSPRGLAGGFFGAAYPATLIYLGDTVPAASAAARHRPADGRRRARHRRSLRVGAGLLADVAIWRAAFVVTGVASLVLAVDAAPAARAGSSRSARCPARSHCTRSRRSPVTLLVLLFAFTEGAVLLGALTLLPPAIENAGATATLAGAVTAVYGMSVFAQLPARRPPRCALAPVPPDRHRRRARPSSAAALLAIIAGAGDGRRRGDAARPGVDVACTPRCRPGRPRCCPRRARPWSRCSPDRSSSAARSAALVGRRPGRRRRVHRHLRGVRRARGTARTDRAPAGARSRWQRPPTDRHPRMPAVQTPTLRDVADAAGVHPATASRALNPATRGLVNADTARRVIKVAESLGYRPNPIARGLKTVEVRHRRPGHPRPDQPALPADRARHRGRARTRRLQRSDRQHRQRPEPRARRRSSCCAPGRSRA